MAMRRDEYIEGVGKILDYQVSIKKSSKIKEKVGKIDLLSRDGDKLWILELKKTDSEETLLRCALEGYTYSKRINIEKLKGEYANDDYVQGTELNAVANPFVAYGSVQELEHLLNNIPILHKLIEALNVK